MHRNSIRAALRVLVIAGLAAGLAPAPLALAQMPSFERFDRDDDAAIARGEAAMLAGMVFQGWDANADDRIGDGELHTGLFTAFDGNADGQLNVEEYEAGLALLRKAEAPAFGDVDLDASGGIEGDELAAAFARADMFSDWPLGGPRPFAQKLLTLLDIDGDGRIDRSEHRNLDRFRFIVEGGAPPAAGNGAVESGILTGQAVSLRDWDFATIRQQGFSARGLLEDTIVYDPGGQRVGQVWDSVYSAQGRLLSLIIEIGGFWDMLHTLVNVPAERIRFEAGSVTVPLERDAMTGYPLLLDGLLDAQGAASQIARLDYNVFTAADAFRGSYLIGDYVRFPDPASTEPDGMSRLGPIVDLFLREGRIEAVIVAPIAGTFNVDGRFALPFDAHGLRSRARMYTLPWGRAELSAAPRVVYD